MYLKIKESLNGWETVFVEMSLYDRTGGCIDRLASLVVVDEKEVFIKKEIQHMKGKHLLDHLAVIDNNDSFIELGAFTCKEVERFIKEGFCLKFSYNVAFPLSASFSKQTDPEGWEDRLKLYPVDSQVFVGCPKFIWNGNSYSSNSEEKLLSTLGVKIQRGNGQFGLLNEHSKPINVSSINLDAIRERYAYLKLKELQIEKYLSDKRKQFGLSSLNEHGVAAYRIIYLIDLLEESSLISLVFIHRNDSFSNATVVDIPIALLDDEKVERKIIDLIFAGFLKEERFMMRYMRC